MSGAINYPMSDIYGGFAGTTEKTVPDTDDQQALVDDQKATDTANGKTVKKSKILLSVLLVLILVVALGGRR